MTTLDKNENKKDEKMPFYKLFAFSDGYDKPLMFVGCVAAIANGLAMPLMTIIFGQLIDVFGGTKIDYEVSKVRSFTFLVGFAFKR
jgi:ATP-binding cassette, subfamily B (MDR/TAP), member 1